MVGAIGFSGVTRKPIAKVAPRDCAVSFNGPAQGTDF